MEKDTGVDISSQHSTEELCIAAARRLSDFCTSTQCHESEIVTQPGKSAPMLTENTLTKNNSKERRGQVDTVHLASSLHNLDLQLKVKHCCHCTYTATSLLSHSLTEVDKAIPQSQHSLEDNDMLNLSPSYKEAYLIPLSERITVDTSLTYPPPPPPSPGDALAEEKPQEEKNNTHCVILTSMDSTQDVDTVMLSTITNSSNPSNHDNDDSDVDQLGPEVLPNPFLELEGNNVKKYKGIECSTPIQTSRYGTLIPQSNYCNSEVIHAGQKQCF